MKRRLHDFTAVHTPSTTETLIAQLLTCPTERVPAKTLIYFIEPPATASNSFRFVPLSWLANRTYSQPCCSPPPPTSARSPMKSPTKLKTNPGVQAILTRSPPLVPRSTVPASMSVQLMSFTLPDKSAIEKSGILAMSDMSSSVRVAPPTPRSAFRTLSTSNPNTPSKSVRFIDKIPAVSGTESMSDSDSDQDVSHKPRRVLNAIGQFVDVNWAEFFLSDKHALDAQKELQADQMLVVDARPPPSTSRILELRLTRSVRLIRVEFGHGTALLQSWLMNGQKRETLLNLLDCDDDIDGLMLCSSKQSSLILFHSPFADSNSNGLLQLVDIDKKIGCAQMFIADMFARMKVKE